MCNTRVLFVRRIIMIILKATFLTPVCVSCQGFLLASLCNKIVWVIEAVDPTNNLYKHYTEFKSFRNHLPHGISHCFAIDYIEGVTPHNFA